MTKNGIGIIPQGLTKEEILERDFVGKKRELRIGRTRASEQNSKALTL